MGDELIRRYDVLGKAQWIGSPATWDDPWPEGKEAVTVEDIEAVHAVDAVEVETVCDMFMHVMRDECPCNYCGVDEWLPEACELIDECPNPADKMGCWKQFIKHYPNRLDYMDGVAMEAEQMRMDRHGEE